MTAIKFVQSRSEQIRSYLEREKTLIVPFGAVEQHGAALPVGADMLIAEALADEISARTGALVAPVIPIGVSAFHQAYPGTISISPIAYIQFVTDLLKCFIRQGFTRLFLMNAHFENSGVLRAASEEVVSQAVDTMIMLRDFWDMPAAKAVAAKHFQEAGGHADAADASLMLKLAPDFVRGDLLVEDWPAIQAIVSPDLAKTFVTSSGVIGSDQRKASPQAGEAYFAAIVDDAVRDIELLRTRRIVPLT